jgi:hypothetical protein
MMAGADAMWGAYSVTLVVSFMPSSLQTHSMYGERMAMVVWLVHSLTFASNKYMGE